MKSVIPLLLVLSSLAFAPAASAHERGLRSTFSIGLHLPITVRSSAVAIAVPAPRPVALYSRPARGNIELRQLTVVPRAGISGRQFRRDRQACEDRAIRYTDYAPEYAVGSRREARRYARVLSDCLEGYGHRVY